MRKQIFLLPWVKIKNSFDVGNKSSYSYRRLDIIDANYYDVWAVVRQKYCIDKRLWKWHWSIAGVYASVQFESADKARRSCDIELIKQDFKLIDKKFISMV